jgi:hypothetical protein
MTPEERGAYRQGVAERRNPSTLEQATLNQSLDQQWAGAKSNRVNAKMYAKRDLGDTFSDAIDRGLSQMGMMAGGTQRLLGEMTGIDSLVKAGDRRIDENKREVLFNPADIGTMDKVNNVGDGFTYVLEKLGEQGPNLLATIGSAAATGGAGAALRLGAAKLASEKLAMQAASSAIGTLGKGMTLTTGAALGAGTLNIGESKLHLDEISPDGDHNLLALSTGLMKTGLDVMSLRQLARPLMGLARQRGMNPGEALKAWGDIPAEVGRAALIEGGTEALQGLLDEAAGKAKYGVDINWQNVKESGAVGLISGGGFAVPINVASVGLQKALQPGEAQPAVADPNAGQSRGADPAGARAEYDAAVQRVKDLQRQAEGLAPDSAERSAIEAEMDTLAARGLKLQGSLNAPPGGTTAEPESDLRAQLAAAADPNHPKPGVWMAGGGTKEVAAANEFNLKVVTLNDGRERGLFASADDALRQKLYDLTNAGMPIAQALAENLYNISADTKANGIAAAERGEDVSVVQNVNADGAVIAEAGSASDQLQETQDALANQLAEGETQRVTTPVDAQARRTAEADDNEFYSQGIRPAAPRPGVRVDAGGGVDVVTDPNANLMEPVPFVGPPSTDPGRAGDKDQHIAHKQLSEFNADAAAQLPQQLSNPIEYPAERRTELPKDAQGNPILEVYPPNSTTMVLAAEPAPVEGRTAVPAGGTLVTYGKRGAPAQRAASIVTGTPVQDRITRVAQEGQAKNRKPVDGSPKEGSGLQRLEMRLRALPYVKRLMLVAQRDSAKVETASGKITVADRNKQILALVRDALFAHLDSVHGIESAAQRERGTTLGAKYGALLHQIANHVSDKDLNNFVEAAHNDNRNVLNAVGRPLDNLAQDKSVGQAQQGRTIQDDDNGRAPAQEEYAGEEVEYEAGFNAASEDAPARAGLREFSMNLATPVTEPRLLDREGKPTGKRWTLDKMFAELRQNPLFANNSPAEIAERFNKWVSGLKNPPQHLLASFVELAHRTYAQRAADPTAYNASSTAARVFEADVQASPRDAAVDKAEQRDIADFGVTRDVNNAIDLSPEQAAYDQEQQAERARRGQPAEPVPKTERQVARFRGSIENKVNLDAAENDGLAANPESDPAQKRIRTLAETLFGDLASVADVLNGLRNRTGQIDAQKVVDSLLKNGRPSKVTRLLLSALKPFLDGYQIVFDAKASEPGSINPGKKVITIRSSMQSAEMLHVMLHEIVHAATVDALKNNAGFAKTITRLRSLAQAHLEKNAVRDAETLQEIKYGLTSNDEFVAQLFSSPAFVEFLETATDAADPRRTGALKTLFNEVISALKKALGLADNVTLAAQAMDTVLTELAKGPQTQQSQQGMLFAPSIRPLADAIRNAEPVQRVLNAPQGARLRTLGTEVATGTGRAKHFLSRAVQAFLTSDHQLRQILTDSLENAQVADRIADRIYVRPGTRGTVGYLQRAENERDTRLAAVESLLHKLENEVVDGRERGRDAAHAVLAEAWAETEWANAALGQNLQLAAELERRGEAPPEGRPAPPMLGPVASELQKIFGQVATYIERAGVRGFSRAYGRDGYYLPQIHDKGEVKARFNEFVSAVIGLEYVNPVTGQRGIFDDASAREYANALIAEHESNSLADLPWSGSLKHRTLTDPAAAARLRDAGFMESSVSNIINYYVDAVTKATEFEREFGGYAKTVKVARLAQATDQFEETDQFQAGHRLIRGTLHGLYGMPYSAEATSPSYQQAIQRAKRDGVLEPGDSAGVFRVWQRDMQFQRDVLGKIKSKQGQLRFQAVFAGMQGNLGADMNPQWRRTQQWLLAVESITTLGFSTLSSLPELGVLAAGAPDWAAFRDGMKAVVVDRKSAWEFLRDMGLAGEHISHIAMADNGVMRAGELPRVIMDKFFKLNGQHYWTQFLRAVALQMFKSTAQRFSESGTNAEFFAQYGVSREEVTQWLADDTPAFTLAVDSTGQSDPTSQFTVHPVAAAMRRFVSEHIAMPNRANVPLFFNDPRFALLVQLKRFFYAYGSQVLMRMARQAKTTYQKAVDRGDTRAAAAVLAAYPYLILGAFSLPLAAASRELKEYLKYDAWGEDAPEYATEGMAYWMDITRRTGVLGPADLAVSLFDERSGGAVSLMGPLAAHLDVGLEHGFFSKEFLRRSTPIAGQLNGVWK